MQFVDFAPVKLVFGPGRLEALRTEPLPGTRALLLTSNGRSMERIGALARVTTILEDDVAFGPENLAVPHGKIGERIDTAFRSPSEALFSPSGKTERHFSSSPASTVV